MTSHHGFKNGAHVRAARAMAGLKQTELAALAALHPNSIKRVERAKHIDRHDYAAGRVAEALERKGVIAETWPSVIVRLDS